MVTVKILILTTCQACSGQAYVPVSEETTCNGVKYILHRRCFSCQGSGKQTRWIDIQEFAIMLRASAVEEQSA
jgi:DnaJ-class molecular chaperone